MPLSSEQKATLQLLLVRGQSYEDLAKVLRVDETEVRSRARSALAALAGRDPDAHVALSDYLLGQADPIARADVVRRLRDDPDHHALATELAARLREAYPDAVLPRLPGEPRPRRAPRPRAGGGSPSFSASQLRLFAALGAAAVVLIVVVLAVTGAFDSGDGSSPAAQTTEQPAADEQLQRVRLKAATGGDATGQAVFGITSGDQPYVDISIRNLDPPSNDQTYVVWLLLDDRRGYPLSPVIVNENGAYDDRLPIPAAALNIVARIRYVDISVGPTQEIQRIVGRAIENTELILEKPGETVLRGTIPRAEGGEDAGAAGE